MSTPVNGELQGTVMWNKKYLLVISVFLFALSLSAQTYSRRRSRNYRSPVMTPQTVQTDRKNNADKSAKSGKSAKSSPSKKNDRRPGFDPSKTGIDPAYITGVMNELRKQLLERKISSRLPKTDDQEENPAEENTAEANQVKGEEQKKEGSRPISQIDYRIYTTKFRLLLNHFELEEATGIRRDWYKQYLAELDKFEPIIYQMYSGLQRGDQDKYRSAVRMFEQHQKACLKFSETAKNYRLSKEQLTALKDKNMKIRKQNYLKSLEQKRQAEMKRRQEQLKQLQQKNRPKTQQKNQQNQKPAQGGVK